MTWMQKFETVQIVRNIKSHLQSFLYTRRTGQNAHGSGYTRILPGQCFGGKTFLVIVDAHSKWLEVLETRPTTEATIDRLCSLFATHGLPDINVIDNRPAFTSTQLALFMSSLGIFAILRQPLPACFKWLGRESSTIDLSMQ